MVPRLAGGMAYRALGNASRRMRLKQLFDIFHQNVDLNINGVAGGLDT